MIWILCARLRWVSATCLPSSGCQVGSRLRVRRVFTSLCPSTGSRTSEQLGVLRTSLDRSSSDAIRTILLRSSVRSIVASEFSWTRGATDTVLPLPRLTPYAQGLAHPCLLRVRGKKSRLVGVGQRGGHCG